MRAINVLIKPSSSKCNLNCMYCFYHDIADNRSVSDYGYMSTETMHSIIDKAFIHSPGGMIHFAFQGGEPTLIGLDFFKDFVSYVKSSVKTETVSYSIQTNGLTIDDEWARFYEENNFLVGISLDGSKDIHDAFRLDYTKSGTHQKVIKKIEILKKFQVDFNILTVVTKQLSRHALKVYNFFKKNEFGYLQFIPCLDPIDQESTSDSLTSDDYFIFLKTVFDAWYKDFLNERYISIRMFDNILGMFLGRQPESCDMVGRCSIQFVIESNGTVYPCDFYVLDDLSLGNINEISFSEMAQTETARQFVEESIGFSDQCQQCKWLKLCRGGCKRHNNDNKHNRFCSTYERFYEYTYDRFLEVANNIYENNNQ